MTALFTLPGQTATSRRDSRASWSCGPSSLDTAHDCELIRICGMSASSALLIRRSTRFQRCTHARACNESRGTPIRACCVSARVLSSTDSSMDSNPRRYRRDQSQDHRASSPCLRESFGTRSSSAHRRRFREHRTTSMIATFHHGSEKSSPTSTYGSPGFEGLCMAFRR
jgi:hypothetical protein